MRLHKWMAHAGFCSRREAERKILAGEVQINGITVKTLGVLIDEEKDEIRIGDTLLNAVKPVYILLNKPVNVISSVKDTHQRKTVVDIVDCKERVYPVGRLDKDSCGLLILTNDGDFTHQMLHPKFHVSKTYRVRILGQPSLKLKQAFEQGILLEGYKTNPASFRVLRKEKGKSTLEITLSEGRNRQIRKICEMTGHKVVFLERIAIGNLTDANLKRGAWRYMDESDLNQIWGIE